MEEVNVNAMDVSLVVEPLVTPVVVDVMVIEGELLSNVQLNVVAAILTGMGSDGAKGLLALKQNGAYTLAQDEYSSVVWGMPKAAAELNAADEIVALDKITQRLLHQAVKV